MKHAPIVALALAAAFVAGCGGGDSITRAEYDEVVKERDDAIEERDTAQTERDTARTERDTARTERDTARTERDTAQTERDTAQTERDDLEEEARHTANQLRQANARRLLAGLNGYISRSTPPTDTIGDTDPAVTPRYRESAVVNTDPGTANNPAVTFSSITTDTRGNWFRTSLSQPGATDSFTDRIDVYSDAEAPASAPFTSVYSTTAGETIVGRYFQNVDDTDTTINEAAPGTVIDDNKVVGSVQINVDATSGSDRSDAVSSSFPRSGAPLKDFDQTDRGYTAAEHAAAQQVYDTERDRRLDLNNNADPADDEPADRQSILDAIAPAQAAVLRSGSPRNLDRFPLRYTAEVSGSLGRASGTFTCASTAETNCHVTNQNNHYRFVGPWAFTPSSAGATVRVDDAEFMYFGWWARQSNTDGSWSFRTFHGPAGTGTNRSTAGELSQLTGTATYQGPAVGHYSFYQPEAGQLRGHSEYGEFTARATLTANFTAAGTALDGDETVSGIIDQFDGHPDWTLTLKQTAIDSNGVVARGTNTVSWSIAGEAFAAPDSGTWEAAFYSNLPASQRTSTGTPDEDATPTGMAGTFEATYHQSGAIIGAFGAHKQP